jgi:hypothetical protein
MSVLCRRTAVHIAGVFLAAGALAACGSSAATGSARAATGASTAPHPSAAAPTQDSQQGGTESDGLGHPVDVCTLLPVATVASVTGEPIAVAKENDTLDYKIYDCDYSSSNGTSGLSVSVLARDAAPGYEGAFQAAGPGAKPIGGLGDKAFSAITGVQALFGNVDITVSNLQSDHAAETLIRALQPKL